MQPEPTISVKLPEILIPEYYVGGIPPFAAQLFAYVGIRYVHVISKGINYYIYEPSLGKVTSELRLYVN